MDVDSSHADLPTEGHFSVSSKRRNLDEEMEDFDNSKKRRLPAGGDIGPKLVNMIKRLDQDLNGGTVETALEDLASVLESNLDPYEGQIIHILYECAAYLPEKITVFSTLVGLLNARSEAFGKALISKFLKELHNLFVKEEYEIFIRLVTFLCDLGNSRVLTQSSILDFLEDFIDNAGEESSKSDFFVYSVLHSLPWIGTTLNEDSPERFDLLLKRIDLYIGKRKKLHTSMLQVWSDQKVLQADYLDSLWMQIQKFSASNWLEKHILRIYVSFNNSLKDAIQHDLPCMDNSIITAGKNYPLPRVVFRLFSVSELPEDEPPLSSDDSIERFLVEEDLNWIIDNNYTDRKSCADALLGYYRKEAIPLNYMITEVIFSQLFRLPKSPHCEIFYGSLLIELCRSQSNSMPQVLAMAAELLFQRVDSMQITCIDRFVDWFSFHLSNFEYRWSWSDWVECIEFDSLHPKRIFVREVIDRCLRLSYHKKLVELLPGEFGPVIPDEPVISYVLDDEGHPAFSKAEQFKELITQRAKDDEILALLIENNANEDEQMEDKNVYSEDSFAVFFAVLLKLASKTLTHSYHTTLTTLTINNEAMQSIILRTLYDSWSLNKQMMTVLVDKMIKMNILEPAIVQAWVFSEEMKIEFKRTWVWDVLTAAIIHLDRRRNKLTRDLNYSCGYLKRLEARNSEREQQKRNGNLAEGGNNEREEGETEENTNGVECGRAKEVSSELNSGDDAMDSTNINNEQNKRRREEGVGLLDLDELIFQAKDKIDLIKNDIEQVDEVLRSVFLNICHKFTLILTEHLLNCETDGTDVETNFYNYVSGRFKYIFLKHDANMWKFSNDLEQELFSSPTIGPRIRQIFEQFVALRR
uniref:Nuclear cap-binding protein subunit 1 n=1 Tax=Meloidogyne floridensis TaxID=298350 RepID=A0A915NSG8_9BILA